MRYSATTSRLDLSFRSRPPASTQRQTPPAFPVRYRGPQGYSEAQLQGEMAKTVELVTDAQKQLVLDREAATIAIEAAKNEAAQAVNQLEERNSLLYSMEV